MAQIFDRSSNALARASLVLTGLIVIALGVTLDQLQRSPWVTRQGQRPDQPVPFSHKHHVQGLGLQCQYCHVTVEKSSYAGIPPTKTCMNCHAQIWTNAQLLEPVRAELGYGPVAGVDQGARPARFRLLQPRDSREQGDRLRKLPRARGPDAADVRAEHLADGVVPGLPPQSGQESAPHSEIYNNAWEKPAGDRPVWCAAGEEKTGVPTAQSVSCVTKDPSGDSAQGGVEMASLDLPAVGAGGEASTAGHSALARPKYEKFTSQDELGHFLVEHYKIRTPKDLTSCEVCHR